MKYRVKRIGFQSVWTHGKGVNPGFILFGPQAKSLPKLLARTGANREHQQGPCQGIKVGCAEHHRDPDKIGRWEKSSKVFW